MGKKKNFENKETFAERHPRINAMNLNFFIYYKNVF